MDYVAVTRIFFHHRCFKVFWSKIAGEGTQWANPKSPHRPPAKGGVRDGAFFGSLPEEPLPKGAGTEKPPPPPPTSFISPRRGLLDQAQEWASYTPSFWACSRGIPQVVVSDVQPLVKSSFYIENDPQKNFSILTPVPEYPTFWGGVPTSLPIAAAVCGFGPEQLLVY